MNDGYDAYCLAKVATATMDDGVEAAEDPVVCACAEYLLNQGYGQGLGAQIADEG